MDTKYLQCIEIFESELTVLYEIAAKQQLVRDAVINKRWADFQALEGSVLEAGAALSSLETRRRELFGGAHTAQGHDFYTFIENMENGAERERLSGLYRDLKSLSAKIRFENAGVSDYIESETKVVMLFLDAAFPEKRGKIYSPLGTTRNPDMRSIIVDGEF
jgi:hypothetical protein